MTAFALLTDNEELVGFLLIAGDDELDPGISTRDCIFTGFPTNSDLLDHELGKFVQDHKHDEYPCTIKNSTERLDLSITASNKTVHLAFFGEPSGRWHFESGLGRSQDGFCAFTAAEE
jgi:hypothetical protein